MQLTNCYCWLLCLRKHQRVCFCYVQFVSTRRVQIKSTADQWIDFKKSWGTNRQSELRGVATGGFPSVCVKARTKARSSSRRSSTSTNHQTKIATKINFHLSSSRRLIMLQKSSSAHRVRAYYHSFLPVQMECHSAGHNSQVNEDFYNSQLFFYFFEWHIYSADFIWLNQL